jgi:UDP-N-acetylglucosamine acyltransferase
MSSKMNNISPQAIIEDGAKIGENVSIAPFCFISKDAEIGDNTTIAQGAAIYGKTKIGKNNEIFSYAVLGSKPQDLKYNGEEVELIIGDNNIIREFTLFNPGTAGGGSKTIIGNNNLFMGYVHVAHDCIIGDNCILANATTLGGHIRIENNAVIGGLSAIHQFVTIGEFAMIAGASAVAQDVPPYCLVEGNRATLRGVNHTGLRRSFKSEDVNIIRKAYSQIFKSNESLSIHAKKLLISETNPYVINILEFVVNSQRGIPLPKTRNSKQ